MLAPVATLTAGPPAAPPRYDPASVRALEETTLTPRNGFLWFLAILLSRASPAPAQPDEQRVSFAPSQASVFALPHGPESAE